MLPIQIAKGIIKVFSLGENKKFIKRCYDVCDDGENGVMMCVMMA